MKTKTAYKAVVEFLARYCSLSIILFNAVLIALIYVLFYFLTPILLNYPPDFKKYSEAFSMGYELQYAIVIVPSMLVTSIAAILSLRRIGNWRSILEGNSPDRDSRIGEIRERCLKLPYILFIQHIAIPISIITIFSIFFAVMYNYAMSQYVSIIILGLTAFSLTAGIHFLFTRAILKEILYRTFILSKLEGKGIMLRSKIMLLVIPVFISAILFTSLLGYSRLLEDRGNFLFDLYMTRLDDAFSNFTVTSQTDIEKRLADININDTRSQYFIIKPNGSIVVSDGSKFNRLFSIYLMYDSDRSGGRVYDETGASCGAVVYLNSQSGKWRAGVRYTIKLQSAVLYYELNFIILITLLFILLSLFSRDITSDISMIADNLTLMSEGFEPSSKQRIPVTSNDEIGELVVAFNKIRDCEYHFDKLKDEFTANISHEFRTPLNIIMSAVQLSGRYLDKGGESEADQAKLKSYLGIMKQNCYRLMKLVNNLIDSTRLEADFFKIHRRNCNIVELVRNITASVALYIKDKGISLEFNTNSEEKIIAVDTDAIERILLNLLSNAVKFSKSEGTIKVSVFDMGKTVDMEIADNGIGIPEGKLSFIFKRFAQVDGTFTRNREGSGIGLSIVKSLVEKHGGAIAVTSGKNKGTAFRIMLPSQVLPESPDDGLDPFFSSKIDNGLDKIDIEFSDV